MGNRHPLKAAKIGQITGGGGWVGVRKRRGGGGPFFPSLPIRVFKVAASPHNFTSSASRRARRNISSDAENYVKVIDMFLPALLERETSQNVTQRLIVKQPMG